MRGRRAGVSPYAASIMEHVRCFGWHALVRSLVDDGEHWCSFTRAERAQAAVGELFASGDWAASEPHYGQKHSATLGGEM